MTDPVFLYVAQLRACKAHIDPARERVNRLLHQTKPIIHDLMDTSGRPVQAVVILELCRQVAELYTHMNEAIRLYDELASHLYDELVGPGSEEQASVWVLPGAGSNVLN